MTGRGRPLRRTQADRAAEHESAEEREALQRVLQAVSAYTGMRFDDTRRDFAVSTIRSMAAEKNLTLAEFARRIGRSRQVLEELTAELSIGETYFFREPAHFDLLRRRIIDTWPRDRAQPLTIWSAACASGEEPYSAAIVAHEAGMAERTRIIGTDISHRALSKAQEAIYRPWSLRGPAADRARPYLSRLPDGRFKLCDAIRRLVVFDYLNLANDAYPSLTRGLMNVHVIFCRNVLIYFDDDVIAAVARKLFETLTPEGWLFVGASDPSLSRYAPFELMMTGGGVVYRKWPARVQEFWIGAPTSIADRAGAGTDGARFAGTDASERRRAQEAASSRGPAVADAGRPAQGDASPAVASGPANALAGSDAGNRPERSASASAKAGGRRRSEHAADDEQPFSRGAKAAGTGDASPGERRELVLSLRQALKAGEYEHVLHATEGCEADGEIAAIRVRALAGLNPVAARSLCERLLAVDPLNVPLRFLHALVLLDLGELTLALQALQRVLFLDRDDVEALFTLATVQYRLGNSREAAKALRTAESLCLRRDPEELLPRGDGATVGELLSAIRRHPAYAGEGAG